MNSKFENQKGMTKNEFLIVLLLLVFVLLLALPNFRSSKIQARDVQRKNDLKHIRAALDEYFKDFSAYPRSKDGKIAACGTSDKLVPCEWGEDVIRDVRDLNYPPYINLMPRDPLYRQHSYTYISNTRNFQIFASLEDGKDPEYNDKVKARGLLCGEKVCNFGLTSSGELLPEEELPVENPAE